jgi:broad specificity phosphatase PhoE
MPATFYLVRHATPDWTRKELTYHMPPGPPLTGKGFVEAEALGVFLRKNKVTQIITSPLDRCMQTAETAGKTAGVHVEIAHSLTEWQPGENYASVAHRMWPIINKALTIGRQNGPPALITHGGPIAALLKRMGMAPDVLAAHRIYDNNNPLPPAAAWRIIYKKGTDSWEWGLAFKPD